ncbi:MAG: ImmA/IrrE family metallo-endopeptidase [bacterium]|nr:ImmA/IrrE family metallo-endopeptidase [bacterium]
MKNSRPAELASQLINRYCIEHPGQLNVEELAFAENLAIKESKSNNFYGRLIHNSNAGIISISKSITDYGSKRFTVAHEIGHYFNERNDKITNASGADNNYRNLFRCAENDINSVNKIKARESDANEFAAELLMHRPWFNDFIIKRRIDFELIKELAEYFNVSLSAAALRYINIGKYPAAVIYSRDGIVKWSAFHEYFPLKFLSPGYKVREETAVSDFFLDRTMQTCADLIPAYVWFAEDYKCKSGTYFYEQSVAMPGYNAVLTLLWESEFE